MSLQLEVALLTCILVTTKVNFTQQSTSCEANVIFGKPVVTCNYPPGAFAGDIYLLHRRNSDKVAVPLITCTWSRSKHQCLGLNGFKLFSSESDLDSVAFEVSKNYTDGYYLCMPHNSQPELTCSFNANDTFASENSTTDSTASSSTTASLKQELKNFIEETINKNNSNIFEYTLSVLVFTIIVYILALNIYKLHRCIQVYRQRKSRKTYRNNTSLPP